MKHRSNHPHSLFIHIVLVLLGAAILTGLIFYVYARLSGKDHRQDFMRHLDAYTQSLAHQLGDPPSHDAAVKMADELRIEIGLTDQAGHWAWKTSSELPEPGLLEKESHMHHEIRGVGFYKNWAFRILPVSQGELVLFIQAPGKWGRGVAPLLALISLIFLFTWGTIRHLLKPLRALESAVEKVGHGKFETRLQPTRPREFYKVAEGFNSMVEKIGAMIGEKEQILRDVSHELRTPLARMKLSLALLPKSKERNAMEEDIRELEALVSEILDAARIDVEDQGARTAQANVSLSEMICEAAKSVSLIYPQVPITLKLGETTLQFQGGDASLEPVFKRQLWLRGDSEYLLRLLRNLVENAAKHTPQGAKVEIFGEQTGNQIVLKIADEGPGIPEEYHEKIFEPFFQINQDQNKKGYGLGLYLCQKIARRYGGKISVENRHPRGAVFQVVFPAASPP